MWGGLVQEQNYKCYKEIDKLYKFDTKIALPDKLIKVIRVYDLLIVKNNKCTKFCMYFDAICVSKWRENLTIDFYQLHYLFV